MKYDTILLAGDRKASKTVFGMNKSLIELNGIPLFMHVLSALQDVDYIGNIYVVGPKSKIEELLKKHTNPPSFPPLTSPLSPPSEGGEGEVIKGGEGGFKKNVIAVEQKANLYENIWHTFLATLPPPSPPSEGGDKGRSFGGYSAGDEYNNPSLMDKAVFVVAGDMPLATSFEIGEFLSKSDTANYDYCIGMTPEAVLRYYYPSNKKPGIKLAYLNLKESKYRISNLHLVKPFKIANREYIEKVYEYRYQKDIKNIVRLTLEIIKRHAGFKSLLFYIFVQMSLFLSHIHLEFLSRFFRQFVSIKIAEGIVSDVLKTRLKLIETSFGGVALDVDNERDFNTIKVMYKEWMEHQKSVKVSKSQSIKDQSIEKTLTL
ncbi:MAG: nucleotidyltransferase family protein [Nitrospinae bacterium]|nr:nucleotidyltransferase family protein [Nitrospinota bacterium]